MSVSGAWCGPGPAAQVGSDEGGEAAKAQARRVDDHPRLPAVVRVLPLRVVRRVEHVLEVLERGNGSEGSAFKNVVQ